MELHLCLHTCITISLIAFYNPVLTLSQNEAEFIRHSFSPARLSPSYAYFDDVSSITCASLCGLNENCLAINYHRSTSKCELISRTDYSGDYQSNHSGWRVYDKVIGKYICYIFRDKHASSGHALIYTRMSRIMRQHSFYADQRFCFHYHFTVPFLYHFIRNFKPLAYS